MIERPYSQVVQWPGTIVGESVAMFEAFLFDTLGIRGKFISEVQTAPDYKDGKPVEGTGGRIDAYFSIHEDDIPKFVIARFQFGMRWVDDVIANEKNFSNGPSIYPQSVHDLCSWDKK